MKVRFEEDGRLVEEVAFPHAELPIGEDVLIGRARVRYLVLGVRMVTESGELKALVDVLKATSS